MLDRTNAERQRRFRARHKAPPLTPRQRGLVIDALRDKMTILDGVAQRSGNPIAAELSSQYRVIFDMLLATWRTE